MKYLSICSGIEAATVAWHPIGWQPVGFAEIEPFPSAVLKHHYPNVPNFGDFTTIKESDFDHPVDLVVGGTPCQSFSVAGKRLGLDDPRGNLSLEFVRLCDRLRPTWILWENVPGVFSSGGGEDFATFVQSLDAIGYHVAWRVLDAQYFGVPQRRRRVFLVGHIADWRRAAQVLFEPDCLRRDTPQSRKTGEEIAGTLSTGFGSRGGSVEGVGAYIPEVTMCLNAHGQRLDAEPETLVAFGWNKSPSQTMRVGETTDALQASPCSNPAIAFTQNDGGRDVTNDLSPTLRSGGSGGQINMAVAYKATSFGQYVEGVGTLKASGEDLSGGESLVAFQQNASGELRISDKAYTLNTNQSASGRSTAMINERHAVRRLTPLECERLQGFFPDDYTRIPWRGKTPEQCPDAPRYKAIGNSMAVPVMRWIGERIERSVTDARKG